MAKAGSGEPRRPLATVRRRCPICGKPATIDHKPFCSVRCANLDLGRWLNGNYRVETEEQPDDGTGAEC